MFQKIASENEKIAFLRQSKWFIRQLIRIKQRERKITLISNKRFWKQAGSKSKTGTLYYSRYFTWIIKVINILHTKYLNQIKRDTM